MTWGIISSGGLKLGPQQNTFSGADLGTTESARDTYFAANPTVFAAYQSNPNNLIRLVYDDTTTFQAYVGGVWVDYTPVLQGTPGEVASLVDVPVGQVPYKKSDGTFGGSRMRMLDDGSLLAPPGFGVESGSVDFGDALTLSESAGFLAIYNNIKELPYTILDYQTSRNSASLPPYVFQLSAAESDFVAQGVSTNTITTNPLTYNYTVQNTARSNALTFKAASAMSNVRIKITQVSNGVALKYIPSKESWETETGGLDWIAGDNTFDFADTPLILNTGDVINFEYHATSMAILGDATQHAYIKATLQPGTFIRTILANEYTATDVRDKLSGLTGTNRLPMSAIKDGVVSVAGRTGVVTLAASDVSGLSPVATSGAYNDLTGKPTIPTATSQLTNDSGYITSAAVTVTSVAGKTGSVTLVKGDVGLGNVDNTSDVNKPVSTAQQTAIDLSMSQHLAAVDPHPQYTTASEAASAAPVQTVNGLAGTVLLTTGNVAESGNLYYTDARVQTYVAAQGGFNVKSAASVGTGAAVYAANTAGALSFRSIIGTGAVTVTQNTNDITINVPAATVSSVNGQTGAVSLTTTNINEGTNLYYTDTRVTNYLSGSGYTVKSVASIGSGSSLYAGNSSGAVTLRSVIGTGVATVTQNSNDITINVPAAPVSSVNGLTGAVILNTSNIAENTNLYYTDVRVGAYLAAQGYTVKSLASTGSGASVLNSAGPSATVRAINGSGLITVTQNTNDITISAPTILGGTYTPTLTSVTNVAASTAYLCHYTRIDGIVFVGGKIDIDPTATGTTKIDISLPVPSNLAALHDLCGNGSCPDVAGQSSAIYANFTNDRASMEFVASSSANRSQYFNFSYRIL